MKSRAWTRALEDIHVAVVPVVCTVRPAYLIDTVDLGDDDVEELVRSLRSVRLASECCLGRKTGKYVHCAFKGRFSLFTRLSLLSCCSVFVKDHSARFSSISLLSHLAGRKYTHPWRKSQEILLTRLSEMKALLSSKSATTFHLLHRSPDSCYPIQ